MFFMILSMQKKFDNYLQNCETIQKEQNPVIHQTIESCAKLYFTDFRVVVCRFCVVFCSVSAGVVFFLLLNEGNEPRPKTV